VGGSQLVQAHTVYIALVAGAACVAYMDGTGWGLAATGGLLVVVEIALAFPAVRKLDGVVSPPERTKLGFWVFPRR
jgi:hypothetical protein